MKFYKRIFVVIILIVLFTGNYAFSQPNEQKVYFGAGLGLDYGGLGVKFEYLPIKYFGIYGGAGYNLLFIGWNAGATVKILPDKKVSPNFMIFYGYNATLKIIGAPEYNITSYGPTIGANIDIKLGKRNKLSVGLFVPIRSADFKDRYQTVKNDPRIQMNNILLPITVGVGFNFGLHKPKEDFLIPEDNVLPQ